MPYGMPYAPDGVQGVDLGGGSPMPPEMGAQGPMSPGPFAPQAVPPQGDMLAPPVFPGVGAPDPGAQYAPVDGLSAEQKALYGEYLALHGNEAQVKLAELDRAAKFRRALSMIQEAFATVTGRPDIAAVARQQIIREDVERANAVQGQILAKVGQRAIEREHEQAARSKGTLEDKQEHSAEGRAWSRAASFTKDAGFWWGESVPPEKRNIDALARHIRLKDLTGSGDPDLEGGFGIDPDKKVDRTVAVDAGKSANTLGRQTAVQGQRDAASKDRQDDQQEFTKERDKQRLVDKQAFEQFKSTLPAPVRSAQPGAYAAKVVAALGKLPKYGDRARMLKALEEELRATGARLSPEDVAILNGLQAGQ
jgi:hypothetical protein